MGSELDPIVGLYHALVFIITADWNALEPFIKRILHLVILFFGVVWTWKWLKKK